MSWTQRKCKRKPVLRPAKIYRPDRSLVCGCIVRDLSEAGARLDLARSGDSKLAEIPEQFILSFTPEEDELNQNRSVTRNCKRVWNRENELGAFFPDRSCLRPR